MLFAIRWKRLRRYWELSKADEIILEIDGKIAYAESRGDYAAKEELLDIRNLIEGYKERKNASV